MRGGSDAQIRIMRGKNVLTSEWGPKRATVRDKKTGEDENTQVSEKDVLTRAGIKKLDDIIKGKGEPPFDVWTPEQAVTITEGKKNSKGKLDWSRLPFESLVGVVRVMEKGGSGYGGYRTWLPGIMFSRLFAAIMRHLIDWFVFVKDKDKESGEHPLCHVIANCMMLLTYINDKTFDDR